MRRLVNDAIHHRVAHVDVAGGHIDLGAQRARAVGELAVLHALEQIEILFHRSVAPRAFLAGFGQRAARGADFFGRLIVDVGFALLDQLDGHLVQLLEVIRGVIFPIVPREAQPADVFLDRVDVLDIFLGGVRVVVAQIAQAAKLLRDAKVDDQRLGVADVQIAVRLRRKARVHGGEASRLQIFLDGFTDEVGGCDRCCFFRRHG